MPNRVEVIAKNRIFDRLIFRIDEARLRYEKFSGTMSKELTRLSLDRGDSAAALVYDPIHDQVVLSEQFRYPTYEKGPGWMIEVVAGIVSKGENPEASIKREMEEEIGYRVTAVQPIMTFYPSPGGTSERIHLFYAQISTSDRVGAGGGLSHEGEDVRALQLTLAQAAAKIESGEICDAKTIISLQWLRLQKANGKLPG